MKTFQVTATVTVTLDAVDTELATELVEQHLDMLGPPGYYHVVDDVDVEKVEEVDA